MISPDLGKARFQVAAHVLLYHFRADAVAKLETELQNVSQSLLANSYLPMGGDTVNVMKNTLENFRVHVACAHHYHLIAPSAYGLDAAERHAAGAAVGRKSGDVTHAVAYERLRAAGECGHHQLAVALLVSVDDFEEEIELIQVITLLPFAFHPYPAA